MPQSRSGFKPPPQETPEVPHTRGKVAPHGQVDYPGAQGHVRGNSMSKHVFSAAALLAASLVAAPTAAQAQWGGTTHSNSTTNSKTCLLYTSPSPRDS